MEMYSEDTRDLIWEMPFGEHFVIVGVVIRPESNGEFPCKGGVLVEKVSV